MNVLKLHGSSAGDDEDGFTAKLLSFESGEPIRLSRDELRALPSTEVFVQKWPAPLGFRYFRNMLSDVMSVSMCETCNRFFHTDDYELLVLQHKRCPVCRGPVCFVQSYCCDSCRPSPRCWRRMGWARPRQR